MGHGHQNIRFTDDPTAGDGVWGYPTSKANFCEEDYVYTRHIAECINCLSNAAYIYLAFRHPRRDPKAVVPWYRALDLQSFALLLVGVFSAVFHGTMHQETQFLDDLSMLVLGGALVQALYVHRQTPAMRVAMAAALWAAIGAVSVVYVRSGDIFIHVATFWVQLTLVWPRTLFLVHGTGLYSPEQKKAFMRQFRRSALVLALGYGLWNIDLEFCAELRAARRAVGLPAAWFLEFHGWWHVFTAIGASWYMRLIRELTADERTGLEKKEE